MSGKQGRASPTLRMDDKDDGRFSIVIVNLID
jgi:hypothetical protein